MSTPALERAWREQQRWSEAANRLKRNLERQRGWALWLAIGGAVLSSTAVILGLASTQGRLFSFAGAAAIGVAGVLRARVGTNAVQRWTRARSVSEAIKSEVYITLAGFGDNGVDDRIATIETDAVDLLRFKEAVPLQPRPLPDVRDVASYLEVRLGGQIEGFYRPRARELERTVATVRRLELGLAVAGALLAAAAGAWKEDAVAIWVPVVTTVSAALAAHAAGERYEYLLVEYLRTAAELERLGNRRGAASQLTNEELVRQAERVISIQNQGWMARLEATPEN